MDMLTTAEEGKKKLTDIIEEIKTCMFTTTDEVCNVFSRPMVTIRLDNEGNLWFFTSEDSGKITDIPHDRQVILVYSHPGKNTYMNVYGSCSVSTDKNKMNELWLPALRSWFPQGLEDPALCLLKVSIEEASYWDNTSGDMISLLKKEPATAGSNEVEEEVMALQASHW
jgi:general stress protein 26